MWCCCNLPSSPLPREEAGSCSLRGVTGHVHRVSPGATGVMGTALTSREFLTRDIRNAACASRRASRAAGEFARPWFESVRSRSTEVGSWGQGWAVGVSRGLPLCLQHAACRLTGAIRHLSPETQTLSYCHALIPSSLS